MTSNGEQTHSEPAPQTPALSPHVRLQSVVLLVNPMSGSVGPSALDEATEIIASYGLKPSVRRLDRGQFDETIDQAMAEKPDVILVLAGDGTVGTVAARAGADGPLIAPLPGGTMNMLPKAIYRTADWKQALRQTLEQGQPQPVAGGLINGHAFYCAAILGPSALWAPAREALRGGRMNLAWRYAQRALRRAFTGQIRFAMEHQRERRATNLLVISPVISRQVEAHEGLEVAVVNPADAAEAMRLAAHAVFDDWRHDPSVDTRPTRRLTLRSRSLVPAILDGETVNVGRAAEVRFVPCAFRALAPAWTDEESAS